MNGCEYVRELIEKRAHIEADLKWANRNHCCMCGSSARYAHMRRGEVTVICESCHPTCNVPGCTEYALFGGEGGCSQHEAEGWDEFQGNVDRVAVGVPA